MALALGAAEQRGSRRAVLGSLDRALRRRPPFRGSREVLTPVGRDPLSLAPALAIVGALLARPRIVTNLADGAVSARPHRGPSRGRRRRRLYGPPGTGKTIIASLIS